jgi:transcriptional regulator with XRE-family HTH domain
MAGHKKFRDLVKHLDADPVRRAEIEDEVRAINDVLAIAALREVRTQRGATQTTLAQALGSSQANVSQIESRMDDERDIYLSTLRQYIEALGGRLELAAVFPDETIYLTPTRASAAPDRAKPSEDAEPAPFPTHG